MPEAATTPVPGRRLPEGAGPGGTAAGPSSPSLAPRFRELILPHIDSAYSLARYLSRDPVAAEDIAQEALLKAFRGFAGCRGGEPKAWLLAIVRNAYFDWRRRGRGWETVPMDDDDETLQIADEGQPSAEHLLIAQGDAAALRAAIEALPEPFREALVLRDLEELSYKEIAQATGVPMGTVMSRLARARAMLGRAMGLEAAR